MGEQHAELRRWIAAQLAGMQILDADETLDDARRMLWLAARLDRPIRGAARAGTDLIAVAMEIATRLQPLTVVEACEALELTRCDIWDAAFPRQAGDADADSD